MKHHAPRKKKKQAKKLKAANDAIVMVRTAMISTQSFAQIAIISATPLNQITSIAEKALKVAMVTIDAAKAVAKSMSDIKHWGYFVPNYRMRI